MNLDPRLISKLEELLNLHPPLAQELGNADTPEHAAKMIMATGKRHDMAFDNQALTSLLQALEQSAAAGEVPDDQLEGVHGGGPRNMRLGAYADLYKLGPEEFHRQLVNAMNHVIKLHEENRPQPR